MLGKRSGRWPLGCICIVYPARWAGLGKLLGLWPEDHKMSQLQNLRVGLVLGTVELVERQHLILGLQVLRGAGVRGCTSLKLNLDKVPGEHVKLLSI